jgi:hypothetical protein
MTQDGKSRTVRSPEIQASLMDMDPRDQPPLKNGSVQQGIDIKHHLDFQMKSIIDAFEQIPG